MEITADRLRQLLDYDSAIGIFRWRLRAGNDRLTNSWNARYAGARAGSVDRQKGYVFINLNTVHVNAARLAWLYTYGRLPVETIDHINGIRADNRLANLREATVAQNSYNRRGFGRSGLKGAYRYPEHGAFRWKSCIRAAGKTYQLGTFETAEEAHSAYRAAAVRLHGEFAGLS